MDEWRDGNVSLEVVYYTQNLPKKQPYIRHVAELALPDRYGNYLVWTEEYGPNPRTVESCIGLC